MAFLTKVTSKGQITIPEEIRLQLAIVPGDQAYFGPVDLDRKEAVIKIVPSTGVVERLAGSLKSKVPYTHQNTVRRKLGQILVTKYA